MRGGGGGLRGDAFWICLTSGEGASGGSRRGGGGGFCCRGDGVAGGGGLRGDAFGGGGGFFLGDAAGALATSGDAVISKFLSQSWPSRPAERRAFGKVLSYRDKCETYAGTRERPCTAALQRHTIL